ncbi:MAG: penicillin-insensitive murein endopeptidase [Kofleriaceae bacterium]|nr:penicillin-insensitive murein endopeptidase [Kofleriaceae bacterium]MCL4228539.1 penicillin-insensitive murein endopeptidase [Myxococcales bacterium]
MRTAVVVSLALTAAALGAARPASAEIQARIKVKAGDTLSTIARRHDCTVAALQRANDLPGTMILAGQELAVPVCRGKEAARPTRRVARIEIPLVAGQSVGRPWDGKLRRASQLPTGKGYLIRRPHRAYGAAHVVAHVRNAIARVRADHPRLHTLAIGDLSAKHGGSISEHRSHQSGRDLDVGFYFKKVPKGYPASFVKATSANLDRAATWDLLVAFARTADDPGGVQAIFVDYEVQGWLHEWAAARGVDRGYLGRLFQYPAGKHAAKGLVRHEPNHDDHFHIRFKCPPGDGACD